MPRPEVSGNYAIMTVGPLNHEAHDSFLLRLPQSFCWALVLGGDGTGHWGPLIVNSMKE